MIIAISGVGGMIGSHLLDYALSRGDEVIAFTSSKSGKSFPESVKVVECGLDQYKSYEPKFKADAFVHLAWQKTSHLDRDDALTQQSNAKFSIDAVNLAKKMGCSVFVGVGSQAEYGICHQPLTSLTPCQPLSEYGKNKLLACKSTYSTANELNMRHCWARVLSVFGKGDAPTTLISYLLNCFKNEDVAELSLCEQTWDYIYAKDCAKALYTIIKNGKHGAIYPVGSGQPRKLYEYVNTLRNLVNPSARVEFGKKEYYKNQPMYLVADTKALEQIGFECDYTFEEGVIDMIDKNER